MPPTNSTPVNAIGATYKLHPRKGATHPLKPDGWVAPFVVYFWCIFGATHLGAALGHVWTAVFKLSGTARWHVSWVAPLGAALFAVT